MPGRRALPPPRFHGRVAPVVAADAYGWIEKFVEEHASEYAKVGFGKQELEAGRKAHAALTAVMAEAGENLRRGVLLPPHATALLEQAHKLVFLGRDAVRRLGKHRADAARRRRFGFDLRLDRRSPEDLRAALKAFLVGVRHDKDMANRAYTRPEFVARLKATLAEVEKLIASKGSSRLGREGMTAEGTRAHEALEDFYDRFAAATNMTYVDDEGTRVMALRLVPRDRDRGRRRTDALPPVTVPDTFEPDAKAGPTPAAAGMPSTSTKTPSEPGGTTRAACRRARSRPQGRLRAIGPPKRKIRRPAIDPDVACESIGGTPPSYPPGSRG